MDQQSNPTTTVTTASPAPRFALVASDQSAARMMQSLQEIGADVFDLPKLKVPSGGATFFTVPDEKGDLQPLKSFDGVIIGVISNLKAWWVVPFGDAGATPPDCASVDGITGVGWPNLEPRPEGAVSVRTKCAECRWNKFGSKRKGDAFGKGKDCSDFAWVFVVRQGDFIPTLLKIPTMSLPALKKYAMELAQRGKQRWEVVTSISLEQDKSAEGGVLYAKTVFRNAGALAPEEAARFEKVSEAFATQFARAAINPSAFAEPAAAST